MSPNDKTKHTHTQRREQIFSGPSGMSNNFILSFKGKNEEEKYFMDFISAFVFQEPEDLDSYDNEIDSFFTPKLDSKRWRAKKVEKKKHNISEEEKKKKAAIECLTAVSDEVSLYCVVVALGVLT